MKFIIESSGSTGSAKKVIVDEQAWLEMAEVDKADLSLTPRSIVAVDRWSTAIHKLCWARVTGCKLAIVPHNRRLTREWIINNKITHLSTIWTTLRWIASGVFTFPSVEVVEGGGEMGDWADVPLMRRAFPNAVIINRYACVEARIICRKHIGVGEKGNGRLPVGKPVKGVAVEILSGNPFLKFAMTRETGEIAIKSPCMADGYYNDPELTAAKFRDGWYHTGDLGYWLPNGELMVEPRGAIKGGYLADTEQTHDERLAKWTLAGG